MARGPRTHVDVPKKEVDGGRSSPGREVGARLGDNDQEDADEATEKRRARGLALEKQWHGEPPTTSTLRRLSNRDSVACNTEALLRSAGVGPARELDTRAGDVPGEHGAARRVGLQEDGWQRPSLPVGA